MMTDSTKILETLTPEKRKLLEIKLKKQGAAFNTFPASFSQQRLWFLQQLEPDSCLYNIPLVLRLAGRLDVPVLEKTVAEIVRRHEVLRTAFTKINGKPFQKVEKNLPVVLPVEDLRHLAREEREEKIRQKALDEWRRPFDLAQAPLFRARLLKLAEDEFVLIFVLHHVITDGWSNGLLMREVAQIYRAFVHQLPSPLKDLEIQYADYANWQQKYLSGENYREQLAAWRQRLAGAPALLNMPADKPRPAFQTNRGATKTFSLSPHLSTLIKDFSKAEGATLFMTFLAAFQILLSRYSGQDDICVGAPIANRTKKQFENLIGFFANTLVLRTDLSGSPTFRELLKRVKEVTLAAYAGQDMPFERLVEELNPERNTGYSPLFQVMLVLQNKQSGEFKLPGLSVSQVDMPQETSTFDLTLGISEGQDHFDASFEFCTDLFTAPTIDRMIQHFKTLLEKMLLAPDEPVTRLRFLSEEEYTTVVRQWNKTNKEFARDQCLLELITKHTDSPEAPAVIAGEASLTYAELEARSNQLAHFLIAKGAQPDKQIGLAVERSIDMIVGLLGILKAGAAYVPLDPDYPQERLAFMVEDAALDLIVTQAAQKDRFAAFSSELIFVDADWGKIALKESSRPATSVSPQNLCYVIYTSGSTGKPKGVLVHHASVVNHNLATIADYDITAQDRLLQFASINFDAAAEEIFPTLIAGGTLVLRPAGPVLSVTELMQLVEKERVTFLDLPTAYWHQLTYEMGRKAVTLPASLRAMIIGGEKAALERYVTWHENGGANVLFGNTYGPTETAIVCTAFFPLTENFVAADFSSLPIGRPIANLKNYILDEFLNPVPTGVPGELYVGGAGVARGYLNRPDLTAERFLPDPFSELPGSRLYKTGDLVRYLHNGAIEYIGRVDAQVKIRGFRVELGEIEAVLHDYAGVRECAVLSHDLSATEKMLLAYIAGDQGLDETALRNFLAEKLPAYMVPAGFVFLDNLPKTPSGKLNKSALPIPNDLGTKSAQLFVAPETPAEIKLAAIFAELLRLDRVGIHDNFFDLGGHSLVATQLASRVYDEFDVNLPLRVLFDRPTVALLAQALDSVTNASSVSNADDCPRISPAPADVLEKPLSFAQQRMWFLDQLEPKNPQYNIPDAMRIRGDLDIDILTACLQQIVETHEVLRTAFVTVDGKPKLAVLDSLRVEIPVTDLTTAPEREREAQARALVLEIAKTGFDLAHAPLFRLRLIKMAEQEFILASVMHHSIADGWSFSLLIQQVGLLYERQRRGDHTPLPPLPLQYSDFAYWQRQWLSGERLALEIDYWRKQLGGYEVLDLPTDHKRPPFQTTNGAHLSFELPKDLTESLKTLAGRENVTLFMALLAAFQTLLYRYTGQEAVAVGSPIANRNRSEIENLLGFFVNTLVLKTDLSGYPNFRALLQRVKEVTLGAYAHQDVPFEKLVDALQPNRDTSRTPLFQVMFLLQNMPARALAIAGLEFEQLPVETNTSNFDLTLIMEERDGQLQGAFEYNTDLFEAVTIARMTEHLNLLLQNIAANPDAAINDYPIISAAEKNRLLVEWNNTAVEYDSLLVHQLFEQQAEANPNAVAVKAGEKLLTYAELESRANRLANFLLQQGVRPDSLVALCHDRALDMIVGLLGILKSGAGYLPLDPNYPRERMEFMLRDAGVKMMLTEAKLAGLLPVENIRLVCLDDDWEKIAACADSQLNVAVNPQNIAYVIYTSGSTGTPKGVAVTHSGLVNHNNAFHLRFALGPQDKVLQFFSLNFDGAAEEIFPALISGATLVLRPAGSVLAIEELLDLVEKEQISMLDLPTAYWHELAFELDLYKKHLPPSVRLVIAGGEAVSPERYAQWKNHVGENVLWLNTYGPTEGTIIAAWYDPAQNTRHVMAAMPIGTPLPNYKIYILDKNFNPAPIGVAGELCIGGAGVARGYLNRPDLTADKFIPDAWSNMPGARLYRTGDLARFLADGNIEFMGRADDQVKIRGFRVELGEIEAQLRRFPQVREAVVVARAEGGMDKKLVVYYVAENNADLLPNDLRAFLKASLPDYMMPHVFIPLAELPKLISGKIDRKALPKPETLEFGADVSDGKPVTETEAKLLEIFRAVLGHNNVGTNSNFFEHGGDSIMSIQVIAKANQAGLRLTPKQLFENPTVAGLAAVAGEAAPIIAEQGTVQGPVELTPIQRWFFEQNFATPQHWNQSLLLSFNEPVDVTALQKAVEAILQHHDMFRARFHQNDFWAQHIAPVEEIQVLQRFNFAGLDEAKQKQEIESRCAELQASLNLENGLLVTFALYDLGVTSRLLIAVHHLVMDAVSWAILLEDLQSAYKQVKNQNDIKLPAKTTSFQHWAAELTKFAQTQTVKDELAYWSNYERQLAGDIPVDFPDQRHENYERDAENFSVSLSVEETKKILELPARFNAGFNDILLAAFVEAYALWSGKRSLLLDMEGHGREALFESVDVSRTVGWFTVLYPLFLKTTRGQNAAESVAAIKAQLAQVPRHGVGYGLLRYLSGDSTIQEKLKNMPAAEISFNYLGQMDRALAADTLFRPAEEAKGPERGLVAKRENLIDVTATVAGERLGINLTFSNKIFHRTTIEKLAGLMTTELRRLLITDEQQTAATVLPKAAATLDKRQLGKVLGQLNKGKGKSV